MCRIKLFDGSGHDTECVLPDGAGSRVIRFVRSAAKQNRRSRKNDQPLFGLSQYYAPNRDNPP
ncbi:MAG: hypothetical protein ILNGONEN_00824 [Syntrophorhabdaceae bacterium]|nr:hypothetical protein [Syntrophorhabdaceae bacterium]